MIISFITTWCINISKYGQFFVVLHTIICQNYIKNNKIDILEKILLSSVNTDISMTRRLILSGKLVSKDYQGERHFLTQKLK